MLALAACAVFAQAQPVIGLLSKTIVPAIKKARETPSGGQRHCVAVARAAAFAEHVVILILPGQCEAMECFAFDDRVKTAFAIVRAGDWQPDANVILKQGVLGEAWRA